VTGSGNRFFKQSGHRLYPRIGHIYLRPDNTWGRAQFYSYEKRTGEQLFSTYLFNLIILSFFAVLAIITIFAEFPGRYLRDRNEY
jgi:hypothetical protein